MDEQIDLIVKLLSWLKTLFQTYLSTLSLASSSAQNLHNSGKSGVRLVHGVWIGKSLSEIIQILWIYSCK